MEKASRTRPRKPGLDMVFATMGSNYADFDNDGFLDLYLGTGEPSFATLIPNRMFKNVAGRRFAEITGTSGTGHPEGARGRLRRLGPRRQRRRVHRDRRRRQRRQVPQRPVPEPRAGKSLADGEARRPEDQPGGHRRRIKVVTAGEEPLTVHRHVSSGSSFGATRCNRRSAWPRPSGSRCWRSTGRPAGRPRSSATSPRTRRSRSPSSQSPTGRSAGSRSRSRNDRPRGAGCDGRLTIRASRQPIILDGDMYLGWRHAAF